MTTAPDENGAATEEEGNVWLLGLIAMPPSVWNVEEPVRRVPPPAPGCALPPPARFVRRQASSYFAG
jgi:hypothetical protein